MEQRTGNRVEQRVGVDVRAHFAAGDRSGDDTREVDAHLVLEPIDDGRPQLWVVMQVGQEPRNCCLRPGASVRPQRPADSTAPLPEPYPARRCDGQVRNAVIASSSVDTGIEPHRAGIEVGEL